MPVWLPRQSICDLVSVTKVSARFWCRTSL